MSTVDTQKYVEFVNAVTSKESQDTPKRSSIVFRNYKVKVFVPSDFLLHL